MIEVSRLRLHMPPGFEARAEKIAFLVGDHLQNINISDSAHIEKLSVDGVTASLGESDYVIAGKIARSIVDRTTSNPSNSLYSREGGLNA